MNLFDAVYKMQGSMHENSSSLGYAQQVWGELGNSQQMTIEQLQSILQTAGGHKTSSRLHFGNSTQKQKFLNDISNIKHVLDDMHDVPYVIKNRKGIVYVVNTANETAAKQTETDRLGLLYTHLDKQSLLSDSQTNKYNLQKMFKKEAVDRIPSQLRETSVCLSCQRYILP